MRPLFEVPDGVDLAPRDLFVCKYEPGGQAELPAHVDDSLLSFIVQLSDGFEGGGTWFAGLGQSMPIDKGHVCCHASGVLHGGHPITSGVRYILVAFVIVEGYQNWAMRFMKSVWDY